MTYNPFNNLPGKFSTNDGTIDFYLRVRTFLNKKKICLDLGAGIGTWFNDKNNLEIKKNIQFIKKKVKKLYAADVDKLVLKNKSSHKNLLIKNNKIPLKSNSLDLIVCDWVFEHIEEPKIFFKEINRILKKKGIVCVRTPYKYNYFSVINSLIEDTKLKDFVLKKSQPQRKKYFKSYYRLNTYSKIKKIFNNFKINYFIFTPDPSYFFGSKPLYFFFKILHFIMPKFFSGIIFCFMTKN